MAKDQAELDVQDGDVSSVDHQIAPEESPEPAAQPEDAGITLTPREEAIARGEDPDAVKDEAAAAPEEETEVAKDGAPTEPTEPPEGTDAQPTEPEKEEDWRDEDVRALAAAYGIAEDELATYGSVDEFERVTDILERRMKLFTEKPAESPQGESTRRPARTPPPGQPAEPDFLDPEFYEKERFDEPTMQIVKATRALQEDNRRLRQQLTDVVNHLVQQKQIEQAQEQTNRALRFHEAVDQMDQERYGRSLSEDGNTAIELGRIEDDNRRRLYDRFSELVAGIEAMAEREGRQPIFPPLPVLLRRAEVQAFAEENRLAAQREYQQRLADQSSRRRPASGRPSPRQAAGYQYDPESSADVANHPEIVKLWNQLQEESGTA